MEQKKTSRRGRRREFDVDNVLSVSQALFWKHGLEGVTLNEIASATGVHKPSLYAAFGDKLGVYLAALDDYLRSSALLIQKALGRRTLRESLEAFFEADLKLFLAKDGRGCFMISTAIPCAGQHPEVAQRTRSASKAVESAFRDRLTRAADEGELASIEHVETCTDILTSTHVAVAVRARSGETRKALKPMIGRVVDMICSSQ